MTLVRDILGCRSLAIVGTEKNTGKTECLNYVLRNLPAGNPLTAVTSIGVDGERVDSLTGGAKPEIALPAGMLFATSEKHYASRRLTAEVLDVGDDVTALGRTVTARSLLPGRLMLSGPSTTVSLRRWMDAVRRFGAKLVVVDGALSRLSSASPTVAEAIILATGAALSSGLDTLIRQTAHTVSLIGLPEASLSVREAFEDSPAAIMTVDAGGTVQDSGIASALGTADVTALVSGAAALYVGGALTDRFASAVRASCSGGLELVVPDFTKVFLSAPVLRSLGDAGVRLTVLKRSRLLAVCVNPLAPNGYRLDSERLCAGLSAAVDVPVYDIMRCDDVA